MYEIKIERPNWLRGAEAQAAGYLVHPISNKYDIIGRLMLEAGYDITSLKGIRFPSIFVSRFLGRRGSLDASALVNWMVTKAHTDHEDVEAIILLNDDPSLNDDDRERRISDILTVHDIKLSFNDDNRGFHSPGKGKYSNPNTDYHEEDGCFHFREGVTRNGIPCSGVICSYEWLRNEYSPSSFRLFTTGDLLNAASYYADWQRQEQRRLDERRRRIEEEPPRRPVGIGTAQVAGRMSYGDSFDDQVPWHQFFIRPRVAPEPSAVSTETSNQFRIGDWLTDLNEAVIAGTESDGN